MPPHLVRELASDALERFLRYVRIDTQSDESSSTYPSTGKQLDLSRLLVEELHAIGVADAALTEHGYVFATVPATVEHEVPTIGFIAHVDTSPSVSGTGVEPVVHRGYDGGDLVLPGDPTQVIRPGVQTELAAHVGHDVVTSDGTTLLGADDKAGVAEIMAAARYLVAHPELPHGRIRIAFTVDEEIGAGTNHFDLAEFGAEAAYTLDGSTAGEVEDETFSASAADVVIVGHNVHPGYAKGKMVNAVKLAADLVARLPRDSFSPETTEGREGYVHPQTIEGDESRAVVHFIVRDHDDAKLREHEDFLRRLADEVAATEPRAEISVEIRPCYRNMKAYLDRHPRVLAAAEEAIRHVGLEPTRALIRGGTDGSRLSEMGLPTPNIFTGGHEFHSKLEWVCVEDMGAAAATIVHLAQVWAE